MNELNHIKVTLLAFGPDEGVTFAQDTWAKLHKAMSVVTAQRTEQEPVVLEPAPENSLPSYEKCKLIIENDDFNKRAKAGLEFGVYDLERSTPVPTELHRFIYEYDDASPYRSAWFLHRLERVLNEATTPPQRTEQEPVAIDWSAVHKKLELVWYRELSADEGLDEIQDLIYTHPPQRTWIGLTDEEKGFCAAPTYVETVARTEAKLKEKNNV